MIPSTIQSSKGTVLEWLLSMFRGRLFTNEAVAMDANVDVNDRIRALLRHSTKELSSSVAVSHIQALIAAVGQESIHVSAMKGISQIAASSVVHADILASQGIGPVITDLLDRATKHKNASIEELCRMATSLAENSPCIGLLEIDKWVRSLVFLMADAVVEEDPVQLLSVMTAVNTIAKTGDRKVVHALKRVPSLWKMLKKISTNEDSQIKALAALMIQSLANVGLRPDDADSAFWQKLLLLWVTCGSLPLSQAAANALQEITTEEDAQDVAKMWLSKVLLEFSLSPDLYSHPSSESEEAEPSVIPSYMRYVADEIRGLTPTEPPEYHDLHHGVSVEPFKLDLEEDHSEETAVSRGISILCDFASDNVTLCRWLSTVQVLTPCRMLLRGKARPMKEQQQIARLIALLARDHVDGQHFLDWIPWLHKRVESPDLLLASNALRGLIHITQGQTQRNEGSPSFPDGIHFFDPRHAQCNSLVMNHNMKDGTVADIVFVHGIRGGPFLTWRSGTESFADNSRASCWPSNWLTSDIPHARLISVQFAAPFTSWEGGSTPLQLTASKLLDKLAESGIGRRPLIFMAHSMGGLVVKELLSQAMTHPTMSDIVDNTRGIVFISTPHHGVWLAHLVWGLRHIGACPAPSLNTMKPGPYLEQLNTKMHDWVKRKEIRILNFAETLSTDVSSMIPRVHVVVPSSAFPGYGESVTLHGLDHINSCKPTQRSDVFYQHTFSFLQQVMKSVEGHKE